MLRSWFCSLALLSAAAPAAAQLPYSAIKPASGSREEYSLQTPVPLDWSAIALAARPDFQPAHPDTNLLRKHLWEEVSTSYIPFSAPIPSSFPRGHYWVLADSGATEVHPRVLAGNIAVAIDTETWKIGDIGYDGSIAANSSDGTHVGEALFSVFSPNPITIRSQPAVLVDTAMKPTVRTKVGKGLVNLQFDTTAGTPNRARAFQVVETGQTFVSVHGGDGDICYGDDLLYDVTTGVPRFITRKTGACSD